jgi:glycosyltransferase involved in cell wall biosynthesis
VRVLITSPSLNQAQNVSGMAAITSFITRHNVSCSYEHFTLGKADRASRNAVWLCGIIVSYFKWIYVISTRARSTIHFNLALDRNGLIRDTPLIVIARLLCRRIILHVHGGEFLTGCAISRWFRFVARVALAKGPIIVLSEAERAALHEVVSSATIFVLPNCIDVDEARGFERTFMGNADLTMLFLGRITTDKGIGTIYDALAILRSTRTRFRFVMAGTGPAEEVYVQKFRDLLGSDFEFVGVVAGSEKTTLLKRCDVFLLPSLFEGMPIALLESMAFGQVPIVTGVGSIPSVVRDGHNGIVVKRQSPEEVVGAIDRLVANREYLIALGQNARHTVLETCSPDHYVRQLNTIYAYDEHPSIPCCN